MRLYTRQEVLHTDKLVKELLEVPFLRLWKKIPRRLCRDLPIFRKHSRLHWHIIWEHILRCSAVTDSACRIFIRRMNYCPLGSGALAGTTYPLGP